MMFNNRALLALLTTVSLPTTSVAFVSPQTPYSRSKWVLSAAEGDDVNGSATTTTMDGGGGGSMLVAATSGDTKSRLASAFAALDETDQYDAVLTGLCAKILDDPTDEEAMAALQDPIKLMQEMNARRVKASGRSLMALIDATVVAQDSTAMADMMSLCLKNGGVSQFGAQQRMLTMLPANADQKIMCPDGTRKTREERLAALADVPVDDRGSELSSALVFSAFAGVCGLANFFGMSDISPYTNTLLFGLTLLGAVDNFYDVINFASGVASKDIKDVDLKLPEKGSLPLGLGTGQVTGTVFRGLVRLTTVDTERECECEAAAFYSAYVLGLPCYAFRSNALESAVMVVESMKKDTRLDPLLSSVGILKMLIWLLAPVAIESSKHAQLVMSDPRESKGLLERLEDKAALLKEGDLFWTSSPKEKEDLLKWAYAEADLLLRDNRETVTEISQRLAGGAATVGDCVAVIEDW